MGFEVSGQESFSNRLNDGKRLPRQHYALLRRQAGMKKSQAKILAWLVEYQVFLQADSRRPISSKEPLIVCAQTCNHYDIRRNTRPRS